MCTAYADTSQARANIYAGVGEGQTRRRERDAEGREGGV